MITKILSYFLGGIGIIIGFSMAEGYANSLDGMDYILFFIPVLLLGCTIMGGGGLALGNFIGNIITEAMR